MTVRHDDLLTYTDAIHARREQSAFNARPMAPSVMTGPLRAVPRIGRVLRLLARHGFLGALRGRSHWPAPEHTRAALEELGVVYVKFGQVLAMRRDLLPTPYVEELERLHDRLPEIDFDDVRAVIEAEFGQRIAELFATFDEEPLAAASIAQVHTATLHDGRRVVVKVRRPGLEQRITEDIAGLTYIAALAEEVAPRLRALDLVGMVREFRESLGRETDLALEGRTIRRFRQSLANDPAVWIPDVVPERTSERVLTLEHSPGERIDVYAEHHPERKRDLAAGIASLVLHQVFETGLFNADPHPGNLFVLPDGRLCLHDFGMIGELDERMRDGLIRVLEATVAADARALTEAYLELGLVGDDADRAALEADLAALLQRIHERPLAELSVGDALESLLRVGGQHKVRNPGPLLLLARAFLIAEAMMRRLDPQLDVVALFSAEVRRIVLRQYSPERLLREGQHLARDVERMVREAPADLRRALRRVGDGELGRVQAPGVEVVGRRATRGIERLTGGVISASFLVAGAILVTVGEWHRFVGDLLLAIGVLGSLATSLGALRGRERSR